MIKEYTKKPIKVKAMKLEQTKESVLEAFSFMNLGEPFSAELFLEGEGLNVNTSNGAVYALWGDYIIKGSDFYPCKEDEFKRIYEEA